MKLKRTALSLMLLVPMITLPLAACGSGTDDAAPEEGTETPEAPPEEAPAE